MISLNQNEFYTGLVNTWTVIRTYATNTSNKQRQITDALATEVLEFGDQKAFWFAELPSIEDYNPVSSLLTPKPIAYAEEFIDSIVKKKIPLTTVDAFLSQAMLSSEGVSFFLAYVNGLMQSAKDNYMYDVITSDLFNWSPTVSTNKEMKQTIDLIDTSTISLPSEIRAAEEINQARIAKQFQKVYDDFSIFTDVFIDVDNNSSSGKTNFKTALKLSDLVFIGNAKYLNEQIIDMMAVLLKSELINENFKHPPILKIPERTCKQNNSENVIGFVAHKRWYQWYYNFMFTGAFKDIDNLNEKRVMHFWFTRGILKNLPVMRLDASYVSSPTVSK